MYSFEYKFDWIICGLIVVFVVVGSFKVYLNFILKGMFFINYNMCLIIVFYVYNWLFIKYFFLRLCICKK